LGEHHLEEETASVVAVDLEVVDLALQELKVVMKEGLEVLVDLLKKPFPVFLVMTTQYFLKFLRHLSHAMDKLMEDIMEIQRLIVRLSTSVPKMEMEA